MSLLNRECFWNKFIFIFLHSTHFLYLSLISCFLSFRSCYFSIDSISLLFTSSLKTKQNKTRSLSLQFPVFLPLFSLGLQHSCHYCSFPSLFSVIRVTLFKTLISSSFLVYTLILLEYVLGSLPRINYTEVKFTVISYCKCLNSAFSLD